MKYSFLLLTFILSGCASHNHSRSIASQDTLKTSFYSHIDTQRSSDPYSSKPGISHLSSTISGFIEETLGSLDHGKAHYRMTLASPQLPQDTVSEFKAKRMFLYLQPSGKKNAAWFTRVFSGPNAESFDFLDSLIIKISSRELSSSELIDAGQFKEEVLKLESAKIFSSDDIQGSIFQYSRKQRVAPIKTLVLNTLNAARTKTYLMSHENLKGAIKHVFINGTYIFVELSASESAIEQFRSIDPEDFERIGVKSIESCSKSNCLMLEGRDVDLLQSVSTANGIELDAYVRSNKLPHSQKIKGFVEFEVKVKAEE